MHSTACTWSLRTLQAAEVSKASQGRAAADKARGAPREAQSWTSRPSVRGEPRRGELTRGDRGAARGGADRGGDRKDERKDERKKSPERRRDDRRDERKDDRRDDRKVLPSKPNPSPNPSPSPSPSPNPSPNHTGGAALALRTKSFGGQVVPTYTCPDSLPGGGPGWLATAVGRANQVRLYV